MHTSLHARTPARARMTSERERERSLSYKSFVSTTNTATDNNYRSYIDLCHLRDP